MVEKTNSEQNVQERLNRHSNAGHLHYPIISLSHYPIITLSHYHIITLAYYLCGFYGLKKNSGISYIRL
jgi:hypothetical protein